MLFSEFLRRDDYSTLYNLFSCSLVLWTLKKNSLLIVRFNYVPIREVACLTLQLLPVFLKCRGWKAINYISQIPWQLKSFRCHLGSFQWDALKWAFNLELHDMRREADELPWNVAEVDSRGAGSLIQQFPDPSTGNNVMVQFCSSVALRCIRLVQK